MAIQVRRGNEADFDASKMLPGELAVSLDARYVRMCFAPGIVLRMATYDSFEADMSQIKSILAECKSIQSAVQRIQSEVNSKASLTIEYANSAKQSADRAYSEAERAKTYANNAEAVTGVQIATKDRAGLIKGGDNHIAEDGTLMLITETTDTTMPNSYDGRLLVDEIGGVCEQGANPSPTSPQEIKYFKGKNLLDCRGLTAQTVKGVTFTPIKDEQGNLLYIEVNGTATANAFYYLTTDLNLPNGDYCLNGYPSATNVVGVEYYVADANAKTYGTNNSSDTVFTSANNGVFQVFIIIKSGYTATNLRFYPMIRKATIADNTYVPYGLLRVATHGKNLVRLENLSTTSHGVSVTIDDGVVKTNGTANNNVGYDLARINLKGGRYYTNVITYRRSAKNDWLETIQPNTAFEVVDESQVFVPLLWFASGTTYNETIIPMICLEEYKDGVEPYKESAITLTNPIEMYGISDVQDVITQKQIKKKFGKTVIDGSVAPYTVTAGAYGGTVIGYQYSDIGMSSVKQDRNMNRLCDRLQPATEINPGSYKNCKAGHWGFNTNGVPDTFFVFCIEESFTTAEQVQAWLKTHPITIVFEINEATESLPTADHVALNSLATYDGITYLEFDSEVEPTFEGEYGTSKVGGYTLDGMLAGRNGELMGKDYANRITALETAMVNNI